MTAISINLPVLNFVNREKSQPVFSSRFLVFKNGSTTFVNMTNVKVKSKSDCLNLVHELYAIYKESFDFQIVGVSKELETMFSLYGIADKISQFYNQSDDEFETAA